MPIDRAANEEDKERVLRDWMIYDVVEALYSPLTEKSFVPQVNSRLQSVTERIKKDSGAKGLERFIRVIDEHLQKRAEEFSSGEIRISLPHLRSGEFYGISVKLDEELQTRTSFWNSRAREVLNDEGIDGLTSDPAGMLLALGMGYWLDYGNLMGEIGIVGERLAFNGKLDKDLYHLLGVTKNEWVIFTHIKHSHGNENKGLYEPIYQKMLDDPSHLTFKAYLASYERILRFMELNPSLDKIVSPGSWLYDPQLPEIDNRFAWVKEIAGKTVPVGLAKDVAPKQLEFALAGSARRRKLREEGRYEPVVTARVINREEIKEILSRQGHSS